MVQRSNCQATNTLTSFRRILQHVPGLVIKFNLAVFSLSQPPEKYSLLQKLTVCPGGKVVLNNSEKIPLEVVLSLKDVRYALSLYQFHLRLCLATSYLLIDSAVSGSCTCHNIRNMISISVRIETSMEKFSWPLKSICPWPDYLRSCKEYCISARTLLVLVSYKSRFVFQLGMGSLNFCALSRRIVQPKTLYAVVWHISHSIICRFLVSCTTK